MIRVKSFAILLFLLLSSTCFSQKSNEAFFAIKEDWSPINDMSRATYFMHRVKENDSTYVCRYYHKNGPMVRCETYKDENLEMPNGRFAWYNSLGNLDSTGMVSNGKKDGYWEFRKKDGTKEIEVLFEKGKRIWIKNFQTKMISYTDGRPDEPLGDSLSKKENVSENKPAEFKGGLNGWARYLEKNLRTPDRFKSIATDGTRGRVVVCFTVDENGGVSDLYIDHSVEWSVDMETLRVFRESPRWVPALQNGKPVIYRHKQSITHVVGRM